MQLEDLLAMAQMPFAGHQTIEQVATAHPRVLAELKKIDPLKTAATFDGLLTTPQLQANCHRIETLIHLSVAYCDGRGTPMQGFIRRSFRSLGDRYCGMMEDPAEDVFVTLVNTPKGNFRIFEAIREGTLCRQNCWMGVSFGSVENWTSDLDRSAVRQGQGKGGTSQRLGDVLCAA